MRNPIPASPRSGSLFFAKSFTQFFCALLCSFITFGFATRADAGALYASSAAGGPGELYILNAATGEMLQDVGPLNDANGTNYPMTGLAFHPITGVLYGSTGNSVTAVAARLVTINPATGLVTQIGQFNAGNAGSNPATMGDLAFDAAGNLYGVGTVGGPQLYSINLTTGKATLVGNTGFLSTTGGGLEISSGGIFYGTPTSSRYGTYDTTTGVFTLITDPVKPAGTGAYTALSFDENGILYGLNTGPGNPPPTHIVTIDPPTGTVTDIGASLDSLDAIALQLPVRPSLAIALANDQITLLWPDSAGFQLEYKTNLSSAAWLTNTTTPTSNNGTNSLTLPIDSTSTFFRLHKP